MASNYKYFIKDKVSKINFGDGSIDNEMLLSDATPYGNETSNPYIISVTNVQPLDNVYNVLVLGANQNLPLASTNYGNPQPDISGFYPYAISISMGVGSVTYGDFLFQTANQPFTIGMFYLYSTNSQQVLTPLVVQHKEATGRLCQDPIIPLLDPYQKQDGVVDLKKDITVDGNAMITIGTMYANSTLNIYMFPKKQVDFRRSLVGNNIEKNYDLPKLNNNNILNVNKQAINLIK